MKRFTLLSLLALAACHQTAAVSDLGAGDNWPAPGGDAAKSHFSKLGDINAGNVDRLGLAWSYDMGSNRVQEATPVVVDGVMFTSGNLGRTYALDATTGKQLWKFEPVVDGQINRSACCDQANRGVQLADGRVFVAALDGMLYALDAKTGAVVWKTDTVVDHDRGYTSTGAPEVAGDLVLIGNGGSEMDVRGYLSAYDRKTGKLAWRFFTVPHDPAKGPQESPALEAAIKTWDPKSRWDIGGGGTPWDAIAYDAPSDTVFVGTGNGGPYPPSVRSPSGGVNLYLSSIVALDRKTGTLKCYYQETPRDGWDFTAVQPMVLTDLKVDGQLHHVIIHSPKNGYLFVIDRDNCKPLAITPIVRTSWADGYDLKTGQPKLTPQGADYSGGPKIVFPASAGARNWYPAAFDPDRNLYFAHVLDMGNLMFLPGPPAPRARKALNAGSALIFTPDLQEAVKALPPPIAGPVQQLREWQWVKDKPFSSELRAMDPLTGKAKWTVPMAGWQDRVGVLATKAGLVFHGDVTGRFNVRDADTGKLLKSIDIGTSIMAAPMTYKVNGVQYVAVQAGWGGGGWGFVPDYSAAYRYGNANRILVFKLDGGAVTKPAPLPALTVAPEPPPQAPGVTPATIAMGNGLFTANCAICHANQPRSITPDLRRLDPSKHAVFRAIVLDGLFAPNGMPAWKDVLSPAQADAIHAFLIDAQGKTRARELALQKAGKPLDSRALAIMSNF